MPSLLVIKGQWNTKSKLNIYNVKMQPTRLWSFEATNKTDAIIISIKYIRYIFSNISSNLLIYYFIFLNKTANIILKNILISSLKCEKIII